MGDHNVIIAIAVWSLQPVAVEDPFKEVRVPHHWRIHSTLAGTFEVAITNCEAAVGVEEGKCTNRSVGTPDNPRNYLDYLAVVALKFEPCPVPYLIGHLEDQLPCRRVERKRCLREIGDWTEVVRERVGAA
jgi:hypothetical protein